MVFTYIASQASITITTSSIDIIIARVIRVIILYCQLPVRMHDIVTA